jgi:hypothetical protein
MLSLKNIILTIIYILIIIISTVFLFFYFILDYKISDYHKQIVNNANKKNRNFNKKVAILITGQIREDSILCLKSQLYYIINPLNADVFCDFDNNINNNEKKEVVDLLNPINIVWKTHNIEIKNDTNNIIRNVTIMYKRKYICNKLKKNYESSNNFKYDIVIRCRPDLFIKEQIPGNIINNIEKNIIYYPIINKFDFITSYFYTISDQMYISDSDTMNKITDIYKDISGKDCNLFIPEKFLFEYINSQNIKIIRYSQKFLLIQYIIDLSNHKKTFNGLSKVLNKYKIYTDIISNIVICARRNRQVYSKNYTCLLANKTGCDKSKVQSALLNYDNHI